MKVCGIIVIKGFIDGTNTTQHYPEVEKVCKVVNNVRREILDVAEKFVVNEKKSRFSINIFQAD